MDILILGHKGMLGHMVVKYLKSQEFKITTPNNRWPNTQELLNYKGDFIINCIANIPNRKDKFSINYELPIWLDTNLDCNIIHPGTELTSTKGYGLSKTIASKFIINKGKRTKMIETSILGPELKTHRSLFEWFLNSQKTVKGQTHNYWSGITTLEWAKICEGLILDWDNKPKSIKPFTNCISKYDVLNIIKDVFNKKITIQKDPNIKINRCFKGNIKTKNLKSQVIELKEFYYGI
tara:strand:+ start:118 stop:825 length:708 start_codon:yes stop_codon:yes gene_type:complete